jgi:hypothetical protein
MKVDRSLLTSDLKMELDFEDTPDSVVHVQLLDETFAILQANLVADITSGTATRISKKYAISLSENPEASLIAIVTSLNSGDFKLYSSVLYVDEDNDGLDSDQELQLGTSDLSVDSDDDGINDDQELLELGTNPAVADSDGDGLDDFLEMERGTNPLEADTDKDGLSDYMEGSRSIYKVVHYKFKWADAKADAERRGGHLATVTNADYDEPGSYNFRLFHPNDKDGSTCHTFKLYQDGVLIGDAFSGGQNDIDEE